MSIGNKEEKFIEINRATKQTKQYCNMLLDLRRELSELDMKFEPNITLSDVFDSLGTISTQTSKVPNVFTDTKPIYTGEVKIKPVDDDNDDDDNDDDYGDDDDDDDDDNDDDDNDDNDDDDNDDDGGDNRPLVTSFDVLPDGRKLVLDLNNDRIQLYDKNNIFITESVLPIREGEHYCNSFVFCSSTEALVLTDCGRVFKVTIGDELAISEIEMNVKIFMMAKYGEDFVAMLLKDSKEDVCLCIIDKSTKQIMKTFLEDNGTLFKDPDITAVSADNNTVYVLDLDRGCYGITSDGQVLFHYQNPVAESYAGLAVVSDGLFIASAVANKYQVEKLNFSGEREEVCTIFGISYPLKVVENELVLHNCDDSSDPFINFYCLLK